VYSVEGELMDPVTRALEVDIERSRRRLPPGLACLAEVAWNMAWCWLPDGISLFRDMDLALWEACGRRPRAMVDRIRPHRLAELGTDPEFLERAAALAARLSEYLSRPISPPAERVRSRYAGRPVAYFCAEYGLHESLPIYAGGLGILAGDHLKSASDLGLPFLAVGLRYRQGYFHQGLDRSGWQTEHYWDTDFGALSAGLILRPDKTPLTVEVPLHRRRVVLQLWGVRVGRVPLILLDSHRDDNDPRDQWITGHLYGGDRDTRLAQEMVLGIGGIRALRALGYEPAVFHVNEGHAAFLALELIREGLTRGQAWEEAVNAARSQTVFTTHTPVAAGHDVFRLDQLNTFMDDYLAQFKQGRFEIAREKLVALGRKQPQDPHEDFGMTPLAIHTSRNINGVSRLHGEVARTMWQPMWPEKAVEETPITHVTNGVHSPTWVAPLLRELLDRYLGKDWEQRSSDPGTWAAVDDIPDGELWAVHCRLKRRLVEFARERTRAYREMSGEPRDYIESAEQLLDPDALTFGFARRVATYKRLSLLLHDPDRALALLSIPGRPVQFVISGKAHPGDSEAKRLVQYLFRVRFDPRVMRRAAFLLDYDISVGREMVQGADAWLNLPRRPLEASGTSGMKASLNGVLNCSILDGWWAEGYNGRNGWAVGTEAGYADTAEQDAEDAESLYSTIENVIIPLYYDRDAGGIPRGWVAMMKEALKSAGPVFNTSRMVTEYVDTMYAPE
jgi:glycogen phosphorylase